MIDQLLAFFAAHPLAAAFALAWAVLVLHLPHRVEHWRDAAGEHARYTALLYRYESGPDYERLAYHGLHVLLALLRRRG
ncbi:MAG: hypothetical protein OHK0022_58900 [Roseiflexaceae bacterium]